MKRRESKKKKKQDNNKQEVEGEEKEETAERSQSLSDLRPRITFNVRVRVRVPRC